MKSRISDASLADGFVANRRAASFGVVIPTFNEAETIAGTVEHVLHRPHVADVVVVDAGSNDLTAERARRAGARVAFATPGRGAQMNRGARRVRGNVLVFLHADCRLPNNACDAMLEVLEGGRDAGLFAIDYDADHPLLRLASRLSSLPVRWTEFGEGALFVRRQRFERLGGFAEWPLFEDVDLLARLRAAGTLGRARGSVLASARRYRRGGVVRQLLLDVALYGLFHVGVSPHRLHAFYEARPRAHGRRAAGEARPGRGTSCVAAPEPVRFAVWNPLKIWRETRGGLR